MTVFALVLLLLSVAAFLAAVVFSVRFLYADRKITRTGKRDIDVKAAVISALVAFAFLSLVASLVISEARSGFSPSVVAAVLLAVAVTLFFVAIVRAACAGRGRVWRFALYILFSVLFMLVALAVACPEWEGVSGFPLVVKVVSTAFQAFTLDADYAALALIGSGCFAGKLTVYVCFAMIFCITLVAPATGGFAIFLLLCDFFPELKLRFFSFRRTKYIFSELNECSVATAESIFEKRRRMFADRRERDDSWEEMRSSVIIFTDAYTDKEVESSAELLSRAKKIGAVCLNRDISEKKFGWLRSRKKSRAVYFLMDKNEADNLNSAITLFCAEKDKCVWAGAGKLDVYVFTRNADADGIISKACAGFKRADWVKKDEPEVFYKVINELKNLVLELVDGYEPYDKNACAPYPLYTGLWNGQTYDLSKLSVLVLGGGRIATEFIKTVYWCGQMLNPDKRADGKGFAPVKLFITVIADDADRTESILKADMPAADFSGDEFCTFRFINADVNMRGSAQTEIDKWFAARDHKPDYVLVALGDDVLNIGAAHTVKRGLSANAAAPEKRRVPVNYVIENVELCRSLNAAEGEEPSARCTLNAFGSLKHRYSYDNICFSRWETSAYSSDLAHGKESRAEFLQNEYNRNSSVASVLHYPYKLVSFKLTDGNKLLCRDRMYGIPQEYEGRLYWLEHRRWTAYMRTIGWSCPTAKQFAAMNGQKDAFLKLHACMLSGGAGTESLNELQKRVKGLDRDGLFGLMKTDEPLEKWLDKNIAADGLDALDKVSLLTGRDYKKYDVEVVKNYNRDSTKRIIIEALVNGALSENYSDCVRGLFDGFKPDGKDRIEFRSIKLAYVGGWSGYDVIAVSPLGAAAEAEFIKLNKMPVFRLGDRLAARGRMFSVKQSEGYILAFLPAGAEAKLSGGMSFGAEYDESDKEKKIYLNTGKIV